MPPASKRVYLVIECSNCKRFLLASSEKRTRTCPYCGKHFALNTARIVGRSAESDEAREILQHTKASGRRAD